MKGTEQPRISSWNVSTTSILGGVNQLLAAVLEKHPTWQSKPQSLGCEEIGICFV